MDDHADGCLHGALIGTHPGDIITADTWRHTASLAQLTSREVDMAQQRAARSGYLQIMGRFLPDGRFATLGVKTEHEAGKGRRLICYERTAKPLPGLVPVPGTVIEDDGQSALDLGLFGAMA